MEQLQPQTPEVSIADSLRRTLEHDGVELPEEEAAPETDVADSGAEGVEAEATEQAEEAAPETPDNAQPTVAEVEIDGKVYQVPLELKDGYLRQADYTRKTQEVAEQRKAIEPLKQTVEQAFAAIQHFGPLIAEYHQLRAQVDHFSKIDWNAYRDQDPIGANDMRLSAVESQNRLNYLAAQMQQIPSALQQMKMQAVAEEAARNLPKARELIPDLDKRKAELWSVGRDYDFTDAELGTLTDPRMLRALRDLAEFKKLAAKREDVQKKVVPSPVSKPGTKAGGLSAKDYKQAIKRIQTDTSDDAMLAALRANRMRGAGG